MSEELKTTFVMAEDGVDPNIVPKKALSNGEKMPGIGMGTFGSDRFTNVQIANAVVGAAEYGQRAFDCASVYGNEKEIGVALKVIQDGGVPREELYITSKVWNDMHGEGQVIASCKQSLEDLQLDYLDLYLVHWPFPNFHAKGCSVDSRSPDAKPYIHENFMKTWAQLEELVEMGLVKSIGTSNMTQAKMELLLRDCKIKPTVTEMELHPHFQQTELYNYYVSKEIQPIAFCPIGSPTRPDRDKTETDTVDIEDPVIKKIAARLGVHPAVVCIKWAVQRGQVPIPFSVFEPEYRSNLKCSLPGYMTITDEEMAELSTIDKKCRLIKGQVFLWKDGQTWDDLWDVDGVIAD
ncbi:aldo/keto reductase family protein [Pontiella sulfatireligans]|uniref:Aldo/keto reductase n=1 Tax=Pontiella sulfatireligans TaxID=2750658 RepID=A0A6C2UST2_9BACT|nr:aldo/keto reductase [Pontiella sulfatireligans]VGO23199.1 Aldo/keto reductase [Pontiella sulfatireligans]